MFRRFCYLSSISILDEILGYFHVGRRLSFSREREKERSWQCTINEPSDLAAFLRERRKGFSSIRDNCSDHFLYYRGRLSTPRRFQPTFDEEATTLKEVKAHLKTARIFVTHCIQAADAAVERPPWPSASFPSVKALADFVKRRRQHASVHTHTRLCAC